jgi:hypothetical protein
MTTGPQTESFRSREIACWIVLCLFVGLFALGLSAAPASADMHSISVEVVSSSAGSHSNCDESGVGIAHHCHTSTGCSAYAQTVPTSISFEPPASQHLVAVPQEFLTGRSTPPNPRPPKRSIQA